MPEPEAVDRRLIFPPFILPLTRLDDAHPFERLERRAQRGPVADAATLVKDTAVAGDDAAEELIKGDGVVVLLEAERPPNDVQQRLELGLAELGQEAVKDHIRYRRGRRVLKPVEVEIIILSLSCHNKSKPPSALTGARRSVLRSLLLQGERLGGPPRPASRFSFCSSFSILRIELTQLSILS